MSFSDTAPLLTVQRTLIIHHNKSLVRGVGGIGEGDLDIIQDFDTLATQGFAWVGECHPSYT